MKRISGFHSCLEGIVQVGPHIHIYLILEFWEEDYLSSESKEYIYVCMCMYIYIYLEYYSYGFAFKSVETKMELPHLH